MSKRITINSQEMKAGDVWKGKVITSAKVMPNSVILKSGELIAGLPLNKKVTVSRVA